MKQPSFEGIPGFIAFVDFTWERYRQWEQIDKNYETCWSQHSDSDTSSSSCVLKSSCSSNPKSTFSLNEDNFHLLITDIDLEPNFLSQMDVSSYSRSCTCQDSNLNLFSMLEKYAYQLHHKRGIVTALRVAVVKSRSRYLEFSNF